MIRWVLLAAFVTAIPALTDMLVDWQFAQNTDENVGYTLAQVEAVNQLVGVSFQIKAEPVYVWRTKQAAQIADALSLEPEDIGKTVDVRRLP